MVASSPKENCKRFHKMVASSPKENSSNRHMTKTKFVAALKIKYGCTERYASAFPPVHAYTHTDQFGAKFEFCTVCMAMHFYHFKNRYKLCKSGNKVPIWQLQWDVEGIILQREALCSCEQSRFHSGASFVHTVSTPSFCPVSFWIVSAAFTSMLMILSSYKSPDAMHFVLSSQGFRHVLMMI